MELRSTSVIVRGDRILKGFPISPKIEVLWDRKGTVELPPATHQLGDAILVFARQKGNVYEPVAASQGTLKLQQGWADQYQLAIQKILDLDAAPNPAAKTDILIDMLTMETRLGQLSALEVIYLEFHTNAFVISPLIKPVLQLTQNSDVTVVMRAIQVLSRIGDKSVVPALIQLMASPNTQVSEVAFRVLKAMTRAEMEFDSRQSVEARVKAMQSWMEWWERNKDKVTLVK